MAAISSTWQQIIKKMNSQSHTGRLSHRVCAPAYTLTLMQTYAHSIIHTYTLALIHADTLTHADSHTDTHTRTQTRGYTQA